MSKKQKALEAEIANDNSQAQDNISQGVVAPAGKTNKKEKTKDKEKNKKKFLKETKRA